MYQINTTHRPRSNEHKHLSRPPRRFSSTHSTARVVGSCCVGRNCPLSLRRKRLCTPRAGASLPPAAHLLPCAGQRVPRGWRMRHQHNDRDDADLRRGRCARHRPLARLRIRVPHEAQVAAGARARTRAHSRRDRPRDVFDRQREASER